MWDVFLRLEQYDVDFGEEHAAKRDTSPHALEQTVDEFQIITFHAGRCDDVDNGIHGDGYHGEGDVASLVVVLWYFAHKVRLVGANEDHATVEAPEKNVKEISLEGSESNRNDKV